MILEGLLEGSNFANGLLVVRTCRFFVKESLYVQGRSKARLWYGIEGEDEIVNGLKKFGLQLGSRFSYRVVTFFFWVAMVLGMARAFQSRNWGISGSFRRLLSSRIG